ncbi:MAG: chloride channel protein [Gammaproteobacteria bacterium]|nr:chloride channel protein [Gammaproteobacteria bacterium]
MNEEKLRPLEMRSIFLISIVIGILTGYAAWLFRLLIGLVHNISFLGQFSVNYDANQHTAASVWGAFIIVVPAIGGVIVIWLIERFAREAKGHGMPEVISAIHNKQGDIRGIVAVVKSLASAITIGTGGSLGREGPIVLISSALSSTISKWLRLSVYQRNLMIACGASGGIAATFNAPLGGILFSMELLLLAVNVRTIMPVVMSSVIAANVGRYLIGPDPAFQVPQLPTSATLENALVLVLYFPFAVVIGLAAVLFIKAVYWSEDRFEALPVNPYIRHAGGALILGVMMYGFQRTTGHYYVQGVGYATIQDVLNDTIGNPWFILLLFTGKLLATTLTLGSGGSGGVFSPSLFLGATLGGFIGTLLAMWFPALDADPTTFALVGMASMVAATTSAPMTAAIMTYEMTLNYSVVLPVMVGVALAYSTRHFFMRADIYTTKLLRRNEYVPRGFLLDVQSQIVVDGIMETDMQFAAKNELVTGAEKSICVIEDEKVIGVVIPVSYRNNKQFQPQTVMRKRFLVVTSGATLRDVLRDFDRCHCSVVVVSRNGRPDKDDVIGVLSSIHLTRALATASKHVAN